MLKITRCNFETHKESTVVILKNGGKFQAVNDARESLNKEFETEKEAVLWALAVLPD